MKLTFSQKADFMKKAAFVADLSSCNYKIGCIGVIKSELGKNLKDEHIKFHNGLTYIKAWNETLPGEIYCQSCDHEGNKICVREVESLKGRDFQKVCSSHAEIGLVSKCAKNGIPTKGMFVFVTNSPCYVCAKALIQSGISEVYYMSKHTDTMGLDILKKNGVKVKEMPHDKVFV